MGKCPFQPHKLEARGALPRSAIFSPSKDELLVLRVLKVGGSIPSGEVMIDNDFEYLGREHQKEQLYSKFGIETEYEIEEPERVKIYIFKYSYLIPLIFEVREKVKEVWGEDIKVVLGLSDDPECGSEPKLRAWVQSPYDVSESRDLQDEFDNSWWLHNSSRALCNFNVGMGFI